MATNALYYKDDGNTRYYCNNPKSGYSYWTVAADRPTGKFCVVELYDGIFWLPYESKGLFNGCTNTTFDTSNWYVDNSTNPYTSLAELFMDCENLVSIDVSRIITLGVQNVSRMFSGCRKLKNINLTGVDTSNIWDFSVMFHNCPALEVLDVSSFNTSKGRTFDSMFADCSSLRTIYASSDFSLSSKEQDSSMFGNCEKIKGGNGTEYTWYAHDQNSYYAKIDRPGVEGYFTDVSYKGFNSIYRKENGVWMPNAVYNNNSGWEKADVYIKNNGQWQYIFQE